MRGKTGVNPPDEALIVMFAEKFGVMPDELEERMTAHWWSWITAYHGEMTAANKAKAGPPKGKHGRRKN